MLKLKYFALLFAISMVDYMVMPDDICKSDDWYSMSMEQLLLKSDIVVLGRDVDHGKFRLPNYLDARFDVHCVLKKAKYLIPSQVIIEDINGGDVLCSGVRSQTEEGNKYIIGLNRELSGYMSYAKVNPLQSTAFPATQENLDKLAAACGLNSWEPPNTGDQTRCPIPQKPRFCTKIRFPEDLANSIGDTRFSWTTVYLPVLLLITSRLYL